VKGTKGSLNFWALENMIDLDLLGDRERPREARNWEIDSREREMEFLAEEMLPESRKNKSFWVLGMKGETGYLQL